MGFTFFVLNFRFFSHLVLRLFIGHDKKHKKMFRLCRANILSTMLSKCPLFELII